MRSRLCSRRVQLAAPVDCGGLPAAVQRHRCLCRGHAWRHRLRQAVRRVSFAADRGDDHSSTGLVAAWSILESVVIAGLLTLIETGGLVLIIVFAFHSGIVFAPALLSPPPLDPKAQSGIAFAGLLAFLRLRRLRGPCHCHGSGQNAASGRSARYAMAFTLQLPPCSGSDRPICKPRAH